MANTQKVEEIKMTTFRVWYSFLGEDAQYARLIRAVNRTDASKQLLDLLALEDEQGQVHSVETLS